MASQINTVLRKFDEVFKQSADCYDYLYTLLSLRHKEGFPKRLCQFRLPYLRRMASRLPGVKIHPFFIHNCANYSWDIKANMTNIKKERYFTKCNICESPFSMTKGTFFEQRKIDILILFKLIVISEHENFDMTRIKEVIKNGNFLVNSNYPSPISNISEITPKRQMDLLKALIEKSNRNELIGYGLLDYITSKI